MLSSIRPYANQTTAASIDVLAAALRASAARVIDLLKKWDGNRKWVCGHRSRDGGNAAPEGRSIMRKDRSGFDEEDSDEGSGEEDGDYSEDEGPLSRRRRRKRARAALVGCGCRQ